MEESSSHTLLVNENDAVRFDFGEDHPKTTQEAEAKLEIEGYIRFDDTLKMESMLCGQSPDLSGFESVVAVWYGPHGVKAFRCHSLSQPIELGIVRTRVLYLWFLRDRFYMVKTTGVTETDPAVS